MRINMVLAEGKVFSFASQERIQKKALETFPFESKNQYIRTETQEFIAVCPFSGLPDIGHLIIEYYPDGGKCVELKSLKYYITSFKDVGIYQEEAAKRIFNDLGGVLETNRLKVTLAYNVRGGFSTTVIEGELR